MTNFRQHDVTDCGAACLAFVFHSYGLTMSIAAIRNLAGTGRSGTTALGLVETCKACSFSAKGLRCLTRDLDNLTLPGIAHVVVDGGRQHYVVVCSVKRKYVKIMDPAAGRVEKWSLEKFAACWTNVFVVLAPDVSFSPSKESTSPWRRLMQLLAPQRAVLTQALIGVIINTILSLSTAVFVQKIVDNVIVDGNRNLLRLLSVGMMIILLFRVGFSYLQTRLMMKTAQRIDAGLILGYYRHLMRLPQTFFDTMRVGEITSRVRDAVAVRDFLNGAILSLILNPLILIFAFAAMFAYSSRLALFSLALIPANAGLYLVSDFLNRRYQRELMENSADFDSHLVESLHAISVVRSSRLEEEMVFRSETRLVRLLKNLWSAGQAGSVLGSAGGLLTQFYSIGLLWIGASLVLDSKLTAGELMSCNALAGYLTGPIMALVGMNAAVRSATTATERLYEVLDLEREKDEGTSELELDQAFELRVQNVCFHYPGRLSTLNGLSVRLSSGTITALVGPSGCGKSTLLALIQRQYQPASGAIFVGETDLQYIRLASLRRNVAYVSQKIDLLAGTILENLAPGVVQPEMTRVVRLCRKVGILEFIESLPRGFHTLVTENGTNLSGGQRQRIAIVRALYSDARIVLMDEPSSALDSESEDLLMQILEEFRDAGRLVLVAAHHQRILRICDKVIDLTPKVPPLVLDTVVQVEPERKTRPAGHPVSNECAPETRRLFEHLQTLRSGGILFGQTDANVMGVDEEGKGWLLAEGRCDVYAVTGKYPAIFGFDLTNLAEGWERSNSYVIPKIKEAHALGAVITVCWHPGNPIGGDQSTGSAVGEVLAGGSAHSVLLDQLKLIGNHLGNLQDDCGKTIPIIFRPWHGANTGRFWWSESRCTAEEYIALYRFTVSFLQQDCEAGNFLYAYAPDASAGWASCLDRYPGDQYVDVFAVGSYGAGDITHRRQLMDTLRSLVHRAEAAYKIPAICDLGFQGDKNGYGLHFCEDKRWLSRMFQLIRGDPVTRRIAYVSFWRNEAYRPTYYALPHPNSPHAEDLIQLSLEPDIVFAGDKCLRLESTDAEWQAGAPV
jgi:ATP-binding cassette subfamily B protein